MATIDDNNISLKNITRCPECNLVVSLSIYYKEITPYVIYYCENNHKGELSLEEYCQKYSNYSISKEKCLKCNTIQSEANGNFSFCCKCNKFICNSCIINHSNNNGQHNITNINRYDALCKLHSNYYAFYCNKCQKNLCIYCKQEHDTHDIINIIQYKNSYEPTNQLEQKIKNIEKKINGLEEIKKQIFAEIDKFKKIYDLEIKFFKILFNTFKYEDIQSNINYNVIENIKNYDETFEIYKMKMLDKINKESNKFISFLQTIGLQKSFIMPNCKEGWGTRVFKLKDGRLAACNYKGDCKTLIIYSKDTFEIQLSINLSEYINGITQLDNENILTWTKDMNVIKLITNKYNFEQKLIGHTEYISGVIEIRTNELISVSADGTMKLWILNNNNQYECRNTINLNGLCSILKLDENEFVTYHFHDKCLKFWDSNNFSNISTINNIESQWREPLCKLSDDILCVGGNCLYLIQISNHQLINKIFDGKRMCSLYKCNDGLILCSIYENDHYSLIKYKYKNQKFNKIIEKEKAFTGSYRFVELDDEIIVGATDDAYYSPIFLWRN